MARKEDRPNLLFVFADQMRGMDMACAGNARVFTPNMDSLAAQGTIFTHAYANSPVCTPSRGTILTGRYPLAHRALANDLPLPTEEVSLAAILRREGYRTGYVGKWHLDGVPRDRFTPPGPRRHGFDYWAAWNCAHDYFQGRVYRDGAEPLALPGYEPVGQTDLAIDFIRDAGEHPFCLFLSWGPPHAPYEQVPEEFLRLYDPEEIELRPNVRPSTTNGLDFAAKGSIREAIAGYYAHITAIDEQLGRLLEALAGAGQAENTIVVFTSDHGDMLWSQGMQKKQQPWEESISIPLLARWPGRIPAGRRCRSLTSTVDFAPTLLGLLGLEAPEHMQGADLSHLFLGQEGPEPDSVFLMDLVPVDQGYAQGLPEWRGIRTGRHTYARYRDGSAWVLYDNEADPYQMDNLAASPEAAPLRREMEGKLDEWLARTGDGFLPWQEVIHENNLVELWNAREREMHPRNPRLL